ncbi:ChuX/HutX family heme-like substrate-binding protein, partial [Methylophaga sp. UBA3996]
MPGEQAQALLEQLADWGTMTTIVLHGGSVFEFMGPFPKGS